MNRRNFLIRGLLAVGFMTLVGCQGFGATEHRYKLAPENILPPNVAKAPEEVREAYRFAIINRDTLRYIPCYRGCGAEATRAMSRVTSKTAQPVTNWNSIE